MIRFELVELWLYFPLYNDNSRLEDSVNCGEEPRRASSQVTIPFIREFARIPTYRTNLPVCVWKHSHRSCSSLLLCRPCHGRCYDVLTTLSPNWSRPFGCKSNPRFFAFVVFCLRLVERANHGFWLWNLWFLYHLHQQESWRGNCSHQGKAEVNLFELHISNSRRQFLSVSNFTPGRLAVHDHGGVAAVQQLHGLRPHTLWIRGKVSGGPLNRDIEGTPIP